jgi:hypothetical protein
VHGGCRQRGRRRDSGGSERRGHRARDLRYQIVMWVVGIERGESRGAAAELQYPAELQCRMGTVHVGERLGL